MDNNAARSLRVSIILSAIKSRLHRFPEVTNLLRSLSANTILNSHSFKVTDIPPTWTISSLSSSLARWSPTADQNYQQTCPPTGTPSTWNSLPTWNGTAEGTSAFAPLLDVTHTPTTTIRRYQRHSPNTKHSVRFFPSHPCERKTH